MTAERGHMVDMLCLYEEHEILYLLNCGGPYKADLTKHASDEFHLKSNILIEGGGCYITDLGLCGPVDEKSSNKIYGIVPYIAPEVFRGKKHTKETDIYSVGMLMWEIFAGHPPFDDEAHDFRLQLKICKGLRPPILPGMPNDYVQMMQRCWDVDPAKRPTSEEFCDFSDKEFKTVMKDMLDGLIIKFHEAAINDEGLCVLGV